MLSKNYWNSALSLFFSFILLISGQKINADMIIPQGNAGVYANANYSANYQGLWGTGYSGGVQGCNTNWQQGTGAVSISDEELEERKRIQEAKAELEKMKLEKKRADSEMEFAKKKLERVFDSEVLDFLVDVHMDLMNQCSAYKITTTTKSGTTSATTCSYVDDNGKEVALDATACGGKTDVPDKLNGKWVNAAGTGYCTATSLSKAGDVSSKICADATLRPEDSPKYRSYSTSECGKSLSDYKKHKLKSEKAQAKIEQYEDEIRERAYAIADAKERAALERKYRQQTSTETDCIECDAAARGTTYVKPKRDWVSILGQVGIGLGLGVLGKQYDDRNAEYNAQLGYPPQQGYPTAVSLGLPFVLGGVYGAINGTSGTGGFACAGGLNGTGGVYGAGNGMNGPFGGAGGVYGPYGNMQGGAFGYPQSMYGTPWGGGMYNPGYGAGGMIAGPWGGFPGGGVNAGYAVNGMINGGFMMNGGYPMSGTMLGGYPMMGGSQMVACYMPPCNTGYAVSGGAIMNGGGYMMNGGGYMMGGGYPMSGYMMNSGYPMTGYAVSGGGIINGGYMMGGGYPMSGYMMNGGYPMSAMMNGGYMVNGGVAMNGGYMNSGYMMGNMMNGGYMVNGGVAMNAMVNGGYMNNGGYMMNAGTVTNGQYQLQMMQMQQQMQQQMMQQQMQYQQAQMQQQMQAYQRQMAVQQQAAQVQQEIASLQVRLQMLYSGAYTSNTTFNTGVIPATTVPNNGGLNVYPAGTQISNPGTGTQITVPNGR